MTDAAATPTISRHCPDGTLVELLYDAETQTTKLGVREPDGRVSVVSELTLAAGERLVPYSASNNLLATRCVLLPADIGDFGDVAQLTEEIRSFLHRYVDLTPAFEEVSAYYVLLTWVYDQFNELPYLRFRGDFGTGKTRALLAVGSLCYLPFFASGASTVSPIFHVLDAFRGTLVLDEADFRFSDATAELTKILNNGNVRGMPVLRTMTNRHKELNPTAFRVFGPKIIAMRGRFTDDALESRFITADTGNRALRRDIPIQLPDSLGEEAAELRSRLLAWRFASHGRLGSRPDRLLAGVAPRTNQVALPLLSIIDDPDARQRVSAYLLAQYEQARAEGRQPVEAAVVRVLVEVIGAGKPGVSVGEILRRLANHTYPDAALSAKRVGWIVRSSLRLVTTKSNGLYTVPGSEWPKVRALAKRFGVPLATRISDAGA